MFQNHQYHQGFSVIRTVLSPGLRYILQSIVKQKNYENVTSESEIWAMGTRTSKDRGVFSFEISQLDTTAMKCYTNCTRLERSRALLLGCQTYYRLFVKKVIYGSLIG